MNKKRNLVVWTSENDKNFYPSRPASVEIPSGAYNIDYSPEFGSFLSKIESKNDENLNILNSYYKILSRDLDKFCSLEESYKKNKMEFNRAILLYGEPGCGKKYLANRLSNYFNKKYEGISIYLNDPTDFEKIIFSIKNSDIKQNSKIFVIIEEVAVFLEKHGVYALLNVLKSTFKEDGIYLVATTNHEDRVSEYIANRPGMFEQKMLIDYPDDLERKQYIKLLSKKFNIELNINQISEDTNQLSLSHIKNLIESSYVFGYDYEEILEDLRMMKEGITASFYPVANSDDDFLED